jgi:hypothetical protein
MKAAYLFLVIFLFGILSLQTACKKVKFKEGEHYLPVPTQRGRGLFACYIDGDTYITKRQQRVTYNRETGYLYILNENADFQFRLFVYEGLFSEGTYTFSNTGEEWISSDYLTYYGLAPEGENWLEITRLDTKKNIIAGSFQIDLVNSEGETKNIRNGRFDLRMEYVD